MTTIFFIYQQKKKKTSNLFSILFAGARCPLSELRQEFLAIMMCQKASEFQSKKFNFVGVKTRISLEVKRANFVVKTRISLEVKRANLVVKTRLSLEVKRTNFVVKLKVKRSNFPVKTKIPWPLRGTNFAEKTKISSVKRKKRRVDINIFPSTFEIYIHTVIFFSHSFVCKMKVIYITFL